MGDSIANAEGAKKQKCKTQLCELNKGVVVMYKSEEEVKLIWKSKYNEQIAAATPLCVNIMFH